MSPLGVVAERCPYPGQREELHEILEPLGIEESAPTGEFVVSDLATEPQQSIAAEAVLE